MQKIAAVEFIVGMSVVGGGLGRLFEPGSSLFPINIFRDMSQVMAEPLKLPSEVAAAGLFVLGLILACQSGKKVFQWARGA